MEIEPLKTQIDYANGEYGKSKKAGEELFFSVFCFIGNFSKASPEPLLMHNAQRTMHNYFGRQLRLFG